MRYLETREAAALDTVLAAIRGQIACHRILGEPG